MPTPFTAEPIPVSSAPDWNAITEEIFCPLCGYNLRGLIGPRCPECGYAFSWPELFDRTLHRHPYLFEHAKGLGIFAFVVTFVKGWMPRRFWRTLKPTHEVNVGRLWIYAVIILVLTLCTPTTMFLWTAVDTARQNAVTAAVVKANNKAGPGSNWIGGNHYARNPVDPTWFSVAFVSQVWDDYSFGWAGCVQILTLLSWPFATFAALMIFRDSMRMAKVKQIHMLRCVIYSGDCLLIVAIAAMFFSPEIRWLEWNRTGQAAFGAAAIMFPLMWYLLGSAYALYLRFDHPYLTALASQVIVFIAIIGFAASMGM